MEIANKKMKLVFYINCADTGSTGKIIRDTAVVLKDRGWESVLFAAVLTAHDPVFEKQVVVSSRLRRAITHRLAKIAGNRFGMNWLPTRKLVKEIVRQKPDIVHIHCANGSFVNLFRLLHALKKTETPTVITNHAEFFYTGNCDHANDCDRWQMGCGDCPQKLSVIDMTGHWWKKMRGALAGVSNLIVTSVSPWVLSRSGVSPIMRGIPQRLVENGVDTETFSPRKAEDVWRAHGLSLEGKRIVLYVTAFFYGDSPKKGSRYLIELARRFAGEDVVFVVVGSHAENLILPENVCLLGRVSDQRELARLYSMADLTLITSQRETFSMPVAESLCCGTPVVGFCAGGPESIAIKEFSEFVDFPNIAALENILRTKWLEFKTPEHAEKICREAAERYDKVKMAEGYLSIYEELTGATTNE